MKLSVIYIMGSGRSGSTILDTVLGNHPQIESVGELINLPQSGWINNEYCACGCPAQSCDFWNRVQSVWYEKSNGEVLREYQNLQRRFEKVKWHPFEMTKKHLTKDPKFYRYKKLTKMLFEAIHQISGKSIIVDSSKQPSRGLALSMIEDINFKVIHLIRDGRGVAVSLRKAYKASLKSGIQNDIPSQSLWRSSAFWFVLNLQAEWVVNQLGVNRSLRLCYEDFMKYPSDSLSKITQLIPADLSCLADKVLANSEFEINHTIAGNRMRMKKRVRIKYDRQWKNSFSMIDNVKFLVFSGWLLKRYGYNLIKL